jgi:hypothetical protein
MIYSIGSYFRINAILISSAHKATVRLYDQTLFLVSPMYYLIHNHVSGIAAIQIMEMLASRLEEVSIAYQALQPMMNASNRDSMLSLVLTEWKDICSIISSQMLF